MRYWLRFAWQRIAGRTASVSNHLRVYLRSYVFAIGTALLLLLLSACASRTTLAPVKDVWQTKTVRAQYYIVTGNDTIYSIAWRFGLDYQTLAKRNHLRPPYHLRRNQRVLITPARRRPAASQPLTVVAGKSTLQMPSTVQKSTRAKKRKRHVKSVQRPQPHKPSPKRTSRKATTKKPARKANIAHATKPQQALQYHFQTPRKVRRWRWPVRGKIVQSFQLPRHKGINIKGRFGQAVVAAASGKVVYAGQGLRGYGKLIILKNSRNVLTAYAYNSKILVREGQWVQIGQKIALMGYDVASIRRRRVPMLHFEIRYKGKPVNPLRYLPKS